MNGKNEVFRILLPIKELFELYQKLSETIITKIDVKGLGLDTIAVNNTISLLCEVGIIQFNQEKNIFQKTLIKNIGLNDFLEIFYTRLKSSYSDAFTFISQAELKYDEAEGKLYIKRNSVNLNLSGLLMLLDGIGKVKIRQNDIFILDKSLLDYRKDYNIHSTYHKTLEELKKQLEIAEKFGAEAELAAMKYEIKILKNAGIDKSPERISEYNTCAGYDIVSYMNKDSLIPDKYIEVKSCSDNNWIFYISRNELEVAKSKQDNYNLYLFNRKNREFRIIQDPYNFLIENERINQWTMEPQVYKVKSLEGLI